MNKKYASAARTVLGTMRDDLYQSNLKRTLQTDIRELKDFMLSEEQMNRLAAMTRFRRWVFVSLWLLRSLYFKLTSVRRLFIVAGIILLLMDVNSGSLSINTNHIAGGILILFILMLELKDKLLAQEELHAGHSVQQALMPERDPQVPGWELWLYTRPANEVGGDFVDFVKISQERYGAILGDVAGKGLSAALLTAKLQSTLRALVSDTESLETLTDKINRIFYRDSPRNIFASLIYIDFQPLSGQVKLINAGHIPPVVLKSSGMEKLEKGGLAIGLTSCAKYKEQVLELQPGETLIVYSDGVTEARNEKKEFFGEERLGFMLPHISKNSARDMGEQIIYNVDMFIGEAKAYDDVSLIILKRK
ncbi:MAG: PP2C family protein-serine/threonine phosphatase [Bacteroidota bacterium]